MHGSPHGKPPCELHKRYSKWFASTMIVPPKKELSMSKKYYIEYSPGRGFSHPFFLQKSAFLTVPVFHEVQPVVCLSCLKYLIIPYNIIFLKSQGSKDIKNDILDCQIHKYTNTNSQIHKYTNTAYDKMTEIPNICYIFEQLVVQGCQKWYSGLSNTQIHKYKYTNT